MNIKTKKPLDKKTSGIQSKNKKDPVALEVANFTESIAAAMRAGTNPLVVRFVMPSKQAEKRLKSAFAQKGHILVFRRFRTGGTVSW